MLSVIIGARPQQQPAWKMRLFSKPRTFSGADSRHASSAAAGGPSKISIAHGLARIAGRWIQRMRTGVEQDQRVHLEAQLDASRLPWRRSRSKRMRAVIATDDLAEPIDVGGKIAPAEAVLRGFDQEAVVAVLLPVVAVASDSWSRPISPRRCALVVLPQTVSCQPDVSSTIEQKMRPMSE